MDPDVQARADCQVRIDRADNGWLIASGPRIEVIEEVDSDRSEAEATQQLLYTVLEMIGRIGSKHDAYRVCVNIVKRDGEGAD
jgi:hypothetical protein